MIKRLLILFAFVTLLTVVFVAHQSEYNNQGLEIQNFQECLIADYEIIETYPEQCITPDGSVFYGPLY